MTRKEITEDNVSTLPTEKAVYGIFAQSKTTNEPINCRYVGETEDLQPRTKQHFSKDESNDCLKKFMQSDLTKILVYELMPNSTKDGRLKKEEEWIKKYSPKCNK